MKNYFVSLSILFFPLLLNSQTTRQPLGQGPYSGSKAENVKCAFAYNSNAGYLPVNNALGSDNIYSTVSHCDCCDQQTQCLQVSDFGFTLPANADIVGISVRVEKKRSTGGSGIVVDNGVRLMLNGNLVGVDKKDVTTDWPTTDTYVFYGGGSDLWGASWIGSNINDSTFGVAIAAISYVCGATIITSIDDIQITIAYRNGTTGVIETATSNASVIASPNPVIAGNNILFSNIDKLSEIKIIDITGKQVFIGNSETNKIKLPYINSGLYFYQIKNENNIYSGKIIIQ